MSSTGPLSPGTMADDAGTTLIDSFYSATGVSNNAIYIGRPFFGQSFTNANATILSHAVMYVGKNNSPTGNMVLKIYAHSGTYGTSSVPTGSALATSDNFDVSTLSTSLAPITFTFSGANRIVLAASTYYVLEAYYAGGDASTFCIMGAKGGGSATGNLSIGTATPTFTADSGYDTLFYIYGIVGTDAWDYQVGPDAAKVSDGVYAKTLAISENSTIVDYSVKIIKADGSLGTENKADVSTAWPSSEAYVSYGSSSDIWSETWTPADINDVDFGVVISAIGTGASPSTSHYLKATNFGFSIPSGAMINGVLVEVEKIRTSFFDVFGAGVDHIRITVYYTEAVNIIGPFPTFIR